MTEFKRTIDGGRSKLAGGRPVMSKVEIDSRREKYRRQGLSNFEINSRIEQACMDRRAGVVSMKPSMKTESFRPNFQGRLDVKKKSFLEQPSRRAEFVQADILARVARDEVARAIVKQKNVERVLRDNSKTFSKVASSKTPEEKAHKKKLKKQRREAARGLTGTEKSDWWSPLLNMGADLLPKLLPMLIGMGDYSDADSIPLKQGESVESNSFLAASSGGAKGYAVPFMHRRNDKVRVTHREYLGDVYSTTANFSTTSFPLNPGMEETFPWCSPVANQFTNYRFLGMVADFVSQGSDYANVAGLGYVALATQYNALAPTFVDKREMMNYEFADAVKPSVNMTHWIECKPNDTPDPEKTVRAGNIPANADLRLYDHGNLVLAVGGNTAAGSIIGMLWISYDIEFYFPKSSSSAAGVIDYASWSATGAGGASPLGTAWSNGTRSSFAVTQTATTIVFPSRLVGEFKVWFEWVGTATAVGGEPVFTGSNGLTILNTFVPGSPNGTTTYWYGVVFRLDGIGPNPTLTSAVGLILPTASTLQVDVFQIPRAPTPSDIFDRLGLNYESKYSSFMSSVVARQDGAMARLALCKAPCRDDGFTSLREASCQDGSNNVRYVLANEDGVNTVILFIDGCVSKEVDLECDNAFHRMFMSTYAGMSDLDFVKACDMLLLDEKSSK